MDVLFKIGPFKSFILQPSWTEIMSIPQRLQDEGFERIRFLLILNAKILDTRGSSYGSILLYQRKDPCIKIKDHT
jgi:hypothetical protein